MVLRALGSTGINVSPIGLGTVKLGRDQGVKYPKGFEIPDDSAASELIGLAKDLGINVIDTAPAYGNSEARLGPLLAGQRHDWVICSKVGEEFEDGRSWFDFSAAHTRASIERSLERLKTDFIDIVLIHSDGNDEHILKSEDVFDELERCKKEGLVRAIGMSTKTAIGGQKAAERGDIVMLTYNPDYQEEAGVVDYCREHSKGVLVKKALSSGHSGDPNEALKFVLSHQGVSSAIVGTINPAHLRANVAAALQP